MLNAIGFLEPAFLWGLLFLGAVLLVHFLKQPRTIRLAFSTLRFFDETAVAANRSRKLRKWLLLVIRLLIITLLVLLFARPFARKDDLRALADPERDLFVWIDPTPSMTYRENGHTLADQAREITDTIAACRNDGTGIYLYDSDREAFSDYNETSDMSFQMRHGIDCRAIGQAFAAAASKSKRPIFLIVSDFQASTAARIDEIRRSIASTAIPVIGCPVTPVKPWNVAVVSVTATDSREPIVSPRLHNFGARIFTGTVSANINNMRTPATACTLAANTAIELPVTASRSDADGWGTVTVTGGDPLEFDNTGSFVFGRATGFKVLVTGDAASNFPIAAALRSSDNRRWDPVCVAPEALTSSMCDSADLIVISECRSIPPPLQTLMSARGPRPQAWVLAAGGSDESSQAIASRLLRHLSLGATLRQVQPPLAIELPETISGLWRDFPSVRITEAKIRGYIEGIGGDALCRLSNGKPAVTVTADALGRRWIVLATPIGISTLNNLCETGFYVPFIDRIFRRAVSGLESNGREPWIAGTPIKNPWYGSSIAAQLLDVKGNVQLRLQLQPSFTVATPGIYRIVPPSGLPYLQIAGYDTLESVPDYRLPESADSLRWTVASPEQMLSYLEGRGRPAAWIVPWLLLALLVVAEVLLRERKL